MKRLVLALITVSMLSACFAQDNTMSKNVSALADEMTNMQTTIATMQYTVDELTLKNDTLTAEHIQDADTISEMQTELTYLSNEITILKSSRAPVSTQSPASTTVRSDASVSAATDSAKAPKIVIIEDVQSMKDSLYSYAYELYRQGKHTESIAKFQEFIDKMPNDDLADNSQYWIGENYYSMNEYQKALEAFQAVISRYPEGGKAPDAMLKVGYTYRMMGQNAKAVETLNNVIKQYPKSGAANLAKQMLAKWQ